MDGNVVSFAFSIPIAAPAEPLALFDCTHLGGGLYGCKDYNGDLFLWRPYH